MDKRISVTVTGRVQGVGYRYYVTDCAVDQGKTGPGRGDAEMTRGFHNIRMTGTPRHLMGVYTGDYPAVVPPNCDYIISAVLQARICLCEQKPQRQVPATHLNGLPVDLWGGY